MEKLLPQNIDAEKGVLGSIIIDPEALVEVSDFLRPEDFYRDAHRTIYRAILMVDGRREPVDFITLCDELDRMGKLEEVGDASYLTSLMSEVPTSGNIEYYGHIVEQKKRLRDLIHAAGKIATLAYEEDTEALEKSEIMLRAIGNKSRKGQATDITDALQAYMVRLEMISRQSNGKAITGVPSGFGELDVATGGFQRGDLIVLAARPGKGKTSWALDIARQLATDVDELGFKTLFFSKEMSTWQLAQRLLAQESGIDQSRMRVADLLTDEENDEWRLLVQSQDRFLSGRFWVDDDPYLSAEDIRTRARRHQAQFGVDLIIVDYLQLLTALSDSGKHFENRVAEVGAISRTLKAVARELQVPVIALAQLNRLVEGRADETPMLSDLRESGAIEQDSDIVLFISRDKDAPESPDRVLMNLTIAKHRNGPQPQIKLWFEPKQTRFRSVDWFPYGQPEPPVSTEQAPIVLQDWRNAMAWEDPDKAEDE